MLITTLNQIETAVLESELIREKVKQMNRFTFPFTRTAPQDYPFIQMVPVGSRSGALSSGSWVYEQDLEVRMGVSGNLKEYLELKWELVTVLENLILTKGAFTKATIGEGLEENVIDEHGHRIWLFTTTINIHIQSEREV